MDIKHGLIQLFIAFDQLVNVLTNPFSNETWADETISSRCGRLGHRYPYKAWKVLIDALFYPIQGPNHCVNAHKKEMTRYHFPPSMRGDSKITSVSALSVAASAEDNRDVMFVPVKVTIPAAVDLMPSVTEIENQFSIGSCTSNATTTALETLSSNKEDLSRLFLYYTSRLEENRLGQDGLQTLRSAMKAASKVGLCLEDEWPYNTNAVETKPATVCFTSAASRKITAYERIPLNWWEDRVWYLKAALAEGLPVVIAMSVNKQIYDMKGPLAQQLYESKDTTGKRYPVEGAHAVTIIGYDDSINGFVYANSWGKSWGDGGFGRLQYRHIGEVFEAWVVRGYNGAYVEKSIPEQPKPDETPIEPEPINPTPTPKPVDPLPPLPEPPLPEPVEPAPNVTPDNNSKEYLPMIIAALLVIGVITKINGFW
jgi:C1A family cysteine protease